MIRHTAAESFLERALAWLLRDEAENNLILRRVSLVFTPPERRRRGYASACVAAPSRLQLERGRRCCFLFADLANPTSNRIYQRIGYRPVCDMSDYLFTPST